MITLLYILCVITLIHYVYDRIILPSYRLQFRNELFEIRDEVRNIIIETDDEKQLAAAKLLHTALNNSINRLDLLTIFNRVKVRYQIRHDKDLRAGLEQKLAILQQDEQISKLLIRAQKVNEYAFMANSFLASLWIFFLVLPIMIIDKFIGMSSKAINKTIMLMTDKQVNKLMA